MMMLPVLVLFKERRETMAQWHYHGSFINTMQEASIPNGKKRGNESNEEEHAYSCM
jgi:hypothetical protein